MNNRLKTLVFKCFNRQQRNKLVIAYDFVAGIISQLIDFLLIPITLPFAWFLKTARKREFKNLPFTKSILFKVGVFPIIDHYYEPLFNPSKLKKSLRENRNLTGIDLNITEQLEILSRFNYNTELLQFPQEKVNDKIEFCYNHGSFRSGDAEYLYNMIRLFKPKKIIEIGSGSSTLMAINAIKKNKEEDPAYNCEHICIEPYEFTWLEKCNVKVIRQLVEEVDLSLFKSLTAHDILFIDSSHIIRPQGDVLFEYLEILPVLNSGVLVHIHDIFTPKDYLDEWVHNAVLWNEQYLLEAFLTQNDQYKIIGATNFLMHNYYDQFASKCPILKTQKEREPGSFWMRKT